MGLFSFGVAGPEEPDVFIVRGARIYDLVPVSELPYGPQLIAASEAGQMAASDYVPIFFKNRLHLEGPQMSTRP